MINFKNISKSFDTVPCLRDISFTVDTGEALALTGPSGSGKTTILRLIAGLEMPDTGTVFINGNIASSAEVLVSPYKRNIGMVFQQPALWPHMTIEENIAFGLSRQPKKSIDTRVKELLNLIGLTSARKKHPQNLSGGEAQRVALARALAPNPSILLLDEPFANLDRDLHQKMLSLVLNIHKKTKITIIYVTHNIESTTTLCPKRIILDNGILIN